MMRILFTGDVYLNPNKNCGKFEIADEVKELIDSCDRVCINLEGPLVSDVGIGVAQKKGPAIRQDCHRIKSFIDEPKCMFDLANNHIMDYGIKGLRETIETVGAGRAFGAGQSAYEAIILTDKSSGKRTALFAVAENGFGCDCAGDGNGYAWFDHPLVSQKVKDLKKEYDAVIVVTHAGLEDENIPLMEIREHYRKFIDYGADCVIAHHPHVIQGKEVYKGKEIFYSLGNAVFEQLDNGESYNPDSIGVILSIGEQIESEVIGLRYNNGVLTRSDKAMDLFAVACSILENEADYTAVLNEICLKHYANEYNTYYRGIFGRASKLKNLAIAILYLIGKDMFDEDMLFHNLLIETHYWTVRRAIRIKRSGYESDGKCKE